MQDGDLMDKIKLKYAIDAGLAVSFLGVFVTGIMKFPGLLKSIGIDVKSLPFGAISKLHDWSGIAMGIFVLVHLILNWQWIVCMTKRYFGRHDKTCEK